MEVLFRYVLVKERPPQHLAPFSNDLSQNSRCFLMLRCWGVLFVGGFAGEKRIRATEISQKMFAGNVALEHGK
jgi:hypothetical protein